MRTVGKKSSAAADAIAIAKQSRSSEVVWCGGIIVLLAGVRLFGCWRREGAFGGGDGNGE